MWLGCLCVCVFVRFHLYQWGRRSCRMQYACTFVLPLLFSLSIGILHVTFSIDLKFLWFCICFAFCNLAFPMYASSFTTPSLFLMVHFAFFLILSLSMWFSNYECRLILLENESVRACAYLCVCLCVCVCLFVYLCVFVWEVLGVVVRSSIQALPLVLDGGSGGCWTLRCNHYRPISACYYIRSLFRARMCNHF